MDFWVCSRTPNTYSIPLLSGLPEKPIWELEMVVVKRLSEQSRQINFAEWCVAPLCLNSFNTIPRNNELHWFSFHLLHFIQTIKTYALQRVSVRES